MGRDDWLRDVLTIAGAFSFGHRSAVLDNLAVKLRDDALASIHIARFHLEVHVNLVRVGVPRGTGIPAPEERW